MLGPLLTANSTGRCNTFVECVCGCFELQCLSGAFVQLASNLVEMCLRMHRQVRSLGKVLSQQSIGVLVRAPLPGALRITKINVDIGRHSKSFVVSQLLAPIPCQ